MNYEKSMIKKKEWLFFIPFFLISVLSGKLVWIYNNNKSEMIHKAVIGLKWYFCIVLIAAVIYEIYKLIKKVDTLDKVWLFSGIFILVQFAGVYQFELLMKYYNLVLNNVVFHDTMTSHVFSIPYVIFLIYYVIINKNKKTKNGMTKVDIMFLFLLLLLPFLRNINSYMLREVIEGLKGDRVTIITRFIFSENMRYFEKADKADKIMDLLSLANSYIDFFYPITIYGAICVGGIALLRDKITFSKYLALGGTFIFIQYIGIIYFDEFLRCFNQSFYSANINLFYKIVLNFSYFRFYIFLLVLFVIKKICSIFYNKQGM
jgi:hypothetical protein